ncbi:DUF2497 domain-containing protein [Phenylobacterium sp. VNQ135]|uniref:DUF2497 domain-containing protein n=1 Tax=Phenylobacterium sp. VNQ135 TaxID=3400922 RepID=UPI003C04D377
MSEQTSQEPTMEEILASIRRIISEDEAPAEGAAPAAEAPPAPAPAPEPEPVQAEAPPPPAPEPAAQAVEADDDDALELTQKVESVGDLDVFTPPEAPEPPPVAAVAAAAPVASLVSERAATAAASAFGQLSAAIAMPREGRTLEDVVRELLTPLLQQWLDENLPRIVQESVEAEVSRIARGRVG